MSSGERTPVPDAPATVSRGLFPVLAHELRSPVSAILGYEELLEDGTFGELDPRATDALRRIRYAAEQLISLIDGVDRLGDESPAAATATTVDANDLIDAAVAAAGFDAEARGTALQVEHGRNVRLVTDRRQAGRALLLALSAAIKASPGAALRIFAIDGEAPAICVAGTRVDRAEHEAGRDGAAAGPLSGVGLRIAFARSAARLAGGTVVLVREDAADTARIEVRLPRLPIDSAEDNP